MKNKWVEQWIVKSESGDGEYTVSKDVKGNFACSCRGWTCNVQKFCPDCGSQISRSKESYCWNCRKTVTNPRVERIECKHIREVKSGGGRRLTDAVVDRMAGRPLPAFGRRV